MPSAENADNIPEGSENAQPAIKPELLERMQEYFAKIQEAAKATATDLSLVGQSPIKVETESAPETFDNASMESWNNLRSPMDRLQNMLSDAKRLQKLFQKDDFTRLLHDGLVSFTIGPNCAEFNDQSNAESTKLTLGINATDQLFSILENSAGIELNRSSVIKGTVQSANNIQIAFESTLDLGLMELKPISGDTRSLERTIEEIISQEKEQRQPKRIVCDPPENGRKIKFMCNSNTCGKTFFDWKKWRNHDTYMHNHAKYPDVNKLLRCNQPNCEYVCDRRSKLKQHEASRHCNEKRFQCRICHHRYKMAIYLKRHMKLVHEINKSQEQK